MNRRFTIRSLMLATAFVAIGCVSYVRSKGIRVTELEAIDAIRALMGPGRVGVAEPGVSITHDGGLSTIYLDNFGMHFPFDSNGFDIYHRVTNIRLVGDVDPGVVAHLTKFPALRSVHFVFSSDEFGISSTPLSDAIRAFRAQSPNVDVTFHQADRF